MMISNTDKKVSHQACYRTSQLILLHKLEVNNPQPKFALNFYPTDITKTFKSCPPTVS